MQGKHEIEVEVYDYDSITKNDLIGVTNIDILPSLNKDTQIELFLQPQKEKKEESFKNKIETISNNNDQKLGKVIFNMKYISEQEYNDNFEKEQIRKKKLEQERIIAKELEEKRIIAEEQSRLEKERILELEERVRKEALDAQYIKGYVQLRNISVRNLKKMDLIGKNDPFVVFRAGEESKQTTVAKSTQNYDYLNEEYELLYDPSVMQGKHEIEVE
ncbi:MAG: hypothetical protein EZS28_051009, partial [Streblomastix strix]